MTLSTAHQAAADLHTERDFAVQVLNTMGQGLTVTDPSGHFTYVNPAYAAMLGYQAGDLVGHRPGRVDDLRGSAGIGRRSIEPSTGATQQL